MVFLIIQISCEGSINLSSCTKSFYIRTFEIHHLFANHLFARCIFKRFIHYTDLFKYSNNKIAHLAPGYTEMWVECTLLHQNTI